MSAIDMTMTCMVNTTAINILENNKTSLSILSPTANYTGKCKNSDNPDYPNIDYGGKLLWTQKEQNLVFAGAFWGAFLSVLPSMFLLQTYSVKKILFVALLTYTVANSFIPLAAKLGGYQAAFLLRFILGLGDGFVTPTINTLISNWFPVSERGTALALNAIGEQIAGVGESPLAAVFCKSSLGWSSVFYLGSIISIVWCVLWVVIASSSPNSCKTITDEEKRFLIWTNETQNEKTGKSWKDVPFKNIFTSIPFLAQLQCHFLMCFSAALMGTYLPTYLKEVLLLGVMANGIFVSLPNFVNLAAKIIWGMLFDKLKEKGLLSPTASVKISQAVSSYGMALSFIGLAYLVDCEKPMLALVLCCTLYACQGIECSGFVTSLLSIAPNYTSTLSSISLFCAQMGIVTAPYVMTALHNSRNGGWSIMFLTGAGACSISGTIFILFGSGETQPWARRDKNQLTMLND
ncbi:unnamed protein product [Auanema sp. JU1783]|nr:unnamed protein product [Auanema sp. JU1783]